MFKVGKSTRGEEFEIAVISSPENLARLDEYKSIARKLADSRSLTDAQARELARTSKVIVHIDGGLHSDEVAGGQHSIQLAYKLVSTQGDPQIDAILNNVILVLWPTINPDGQNMVVSWYRRNLGTSFEVSPMPWLYQDYVGHDNNRDGYMLNMIESQVVTRTEIEYSPVIFYCQHQTAPFPARIWIPPFADPISSNISPYMRSWLNVVGTQMSAALQQQHLPGAISQAQYDNWYPGFLDFTHVFRNEISFFTETALYRYATPRFYTVNEFPKPSQDLKALTMYTDPWQGGWWRLERRRQVHGRRIHVRARHFRKISRAASLQPLAGRARQHRALQARRALRLRAAQPAGRHARGRTPRAKTPRQRTRSPSRRPHLPRKRHRLSRWLVGCS